MGYMGLEITGFDEIIKFFENEKITERNLIITNKLSGEIAVIKVPEKDWERISPIVGIKVNNEVIME